MLQRIMKLIFVVTFLLGIVGCSTPEGTSLEIPPPMAATEEENIDRPIDLSLEITFPAQRSNLESNLLKLTGIVSVSEADVTIEHGNAQTKASVSEDGSFYDWIDLLKGANTIKVIATSGEESVVKTLDVAFKPPLAIWVDGPPKVTSSSGNTVIATLSGYTTDPESKVTVNSLPVHATLEDNVLKTPENWDDIQNSSPAEVGSDGFYSGNTQLEFRPDAELATYYVLMAKATRESETDQDYTIIFWLSRNGELGSPPPFKRSGGPFYSAPPYPELTTVHMKAGEKKRIPLLLNVKKEIELPYIAHTLSCDISRVDKQYSEVKINVPEGLDVCISPGTFTVWSMVDYQPEMVVETTDPLPPGEYWFFTDYFLDDKIWRRGWVDVIIGP